jgi:hypothetical protein
MLMTFHADQKKFTTPVRQIYLSSQTPLHQLSLPGQKDLRRGNDRLGSPLQVARIAFNVPRQFHYVTYKTNKHLRSRLIDGLTAKPLLLFIDTPVPKERVPALNPKTYNAFQIADG